MIGTPFFSKDEILNRKVQNIDRKPWEQLGVDDQGRKHFHGAFKGGTQAGYKGTAGSKEGWAPTAFVSSKQGGEFKKQTIHDFMDEEDIVSGFIMHSGWARGWLYFHGQGRLRHPWQEGESNAQAESGSKRAGWRGCPWWIHCGL